jgi:hypothetical protein
MTEREAHGFGDANEGDPDDELDNGTNAGQLNDESVASSEGDSSVGATADVHSPEIGDRPGCQNSSPPQTPATGTVTRNKLKQLRLQFGTSPRTPANRD